MAVMVVSTVPPHLCLPIILSCPSSHGPLISTVSSPCLVMSLLTRSSHLKCVFPLSCHVPSHTVLSSQLCLPLALSCPSSHGPLISTVSSPCLVMSPLTRSSHLNCVFPLSCHVPSHTVLSSQLCLPLVLSCPLSHGPLISTVSSPCLVMSPLTRSSHLNCVFPLSCHVPLTRSTSSQLCLPLALSCPSSHGPLISTVSSPCLAMSPPHTVHSISTVSSPCLVMSPLTRSSHLNCVFPLSCHVPSHTVLSSQLCLPLALSCPSSHGPLISTVSSPCLVMSPLTRSSHLNCVFPLSCHVPPHTVLSSQLFFPLPCHVPPHTVLPSQLCLPLALSCPSSHGPLISTVSSLSCHVPPHTVLSSQLCLPLSCHVPHTVLPFQLCLPLVLSCPSSHGPLISTVSSPPLSCHVPSSHGPLISTVSSPYLVMSLTRSSHLNCVFPLSCHVPPHTVLSSQLCPPLILSCPSHGPLISTVSSPCLVMSPLTRSSHLNCVFPLSCHVPSHTVLSSQLCLPLVLSCPLSHGPPISTVSSPCLVMSPLTRSSHLNCVFPLSCHVPSHTVLPSQLCIPLILSCPSSHGPPISTMSSPYLLMSLIIRSSHINCAFPFLCALAVFLFRLSLPISCFPRDLPISADLLRTTPVKVSTFQFLPLDRAAW